MKRLAAALMLTLAAPAVAQGPSWQQVEAAEAACAERVRAALKAAGFRGIYALAENGRRLGGGTIGDVLPYEAVFPLASFTKQVVAVMVMQQVEAGRVALDAPAARYLPALGPGGPTVRQLLQHRSGLRNPEDGDKAAGGAPSGLAWCLARRGRPGGQWRYNNCDYVVLGALVERVTRRPLAEVYAERIAGPTGMGALFQASGGDTRADAAWTGGPTAAERTTLVRYGAAGGLVGTAEDVLAFDAALLDGRLLGTRARAELWRGDPALGYQALGQWSFAAPLKGCGAAVQIVERRGGIGRFQLRNVILPGTGTALVLLTPDGEFDFGEIWQGKGATFDALSAACPVGEGA